MKSTASNEWFAVLVHETTHVWQHQHGGTDYLSEAAYAQMFGEGYIFDDAISRGKTWVMLNPEQQGHLIESAYRAGFFQTGQWLVPETNPPQFRSDLATYMQGVMPQLRAGQGAT